MQDDDIRLAELMCARLCHDLAGPVGAVSNGAELLEENDPELASEAASLMAGAALQIGQRLRFFRAAFGWEGGAAKSLAEAGKIVADFLAPLPGQQARFEIAPPHGETPAADGIKLLLLLTLFGSEALPRGGRLALQAGPDFVQVTASGAGAAAADEVIELLLGRTVPDQPTPRQAPVLLALGVARRFCWKISVESRQEQTIFRAKR